MWILDNGTRICNQCNSQMFTKQEREQVIGDTVAALRGPLALLAQWSSLAG